MLTITDYAISMLERGFRQRGPAVSELAGNPDFAIPSRVLIVNSAAFASSLPILNMDGRAVMVDLPNDVFYRETRGPISVSMSLITYEESVFFGLIADREDRERLMLPICPEEHPDVLTWLLRSDALVLGHTYPSLDDDEFAVSIVAAMNMSTSVNLRMATLILNALNGWPVPSLN